MCRMNGGKTLERAPGANVREMTLGEPVDRTNSSGPNTFALEAVTAKLTGVDRAEARGAVAESPHALRNNAV